MSANIYKSKTVHHQWFNNRILQALLVALYFQILLWHHSHLCSLWVLSYLVHPCLPLNIRVTLASRRNILRHAGHFMR